MSKLARHHGFTLIEVVVSLSVFIAILIPIVAVTTLSLYNAQFAKNQSQATKYAQEGMENIRVLRDSSWRDFWSYVSGENLCFSDSEPQAGSECNSDCKIGSSIFYRCVTMEDQSADGAANEARVTITVSWVQGTKTHSSRLISTFTKWQ